MAKAVKNLPIHSFLNERIVLRSLQGVRALVALDEVGRGCLAGPVVTGASLWIPESAFPDADPVGLQKLWLPLIRDSKKLTPRARDICFEGVSQSFSALRAPSADIVCQGQAVPLSFDACVKPLRPSIAFDTKGKLGDTVAWNDLPSERFFCCGIAVGAASAQEVDDINIWNAVQLAMGRALLLLVQDVPKAAASALAQAALVVDGNHSVRVPKSFASLVQLTAIGGDDHFVSVGLSSVVAKVIRDRTLESLDPEFPAYMFGKHKGYGTADHRAALERHGPTVHHRKSFLGSFSFDS